MDFFSFIPAGLYNTIYTYTVVILCLITVLYYASSNENNVLKAKSTSSFYPVIILSVFLILFMGLRPFTREFGDTSMYAHWYNSAIVTGSLIEDDKEWIWTLIASICADFGLEVNMWFLVIEVLYISTMVACCWVLMRNNLWVAVLFCFVSFSFYSYGINGIRNGLACSIVMLAIALLCRNNYAKLVGILLMVVAYGIHNSTALPSLCAISSLFLIKNPKYAISFWGVSIILSLIIGNTIGDFFASLGFDDRTHYFEDVSESANAEQFSSTGFRFDFLLYSAMPVLMTWYVTIKRNFQDSTFNLIANTYILANAFWIMVIRATFSNRFAYLSWFLYPLVIVYPLIRFNIWDDQDKKVAMILLAYTGFTFIMYLIGR